MEVNSIQIVKYEVWSLLNPNLIVNISSYIDKKKDIMALYRSQLHYIDYISMIEVISKARSFVKAANNVKRGWYGDGSAVTRVKVLRD